MSHCWGSRGRTSLRSLACWARVFSGETREARSLKAEAGGSPPRRSQSPEPGEGLAAGYGAWIAEQPDRPQTQTEPPREGQQTQPLAGGRRAAHAGGGSGFLSPGQHRPRVQRSCRRTIRKPAASGAPGAAHLEGRLPSVKQTRPASPAAAAQAAWKPPARQRHGPRL